MRYVRGLLALGFFCAHARRPCALTKLTLSHRRELRFGGPGGFRNSASRAPLGLRGAPGPHSSFFRKLRPGLLAACEASFIYKSSPGGVLFGIKVAWQQRMPNVTSLPGIQLFCYPLPDATFVGLLFWWAAVPLDFLITKKACAGMWKNLLGLVWDARTSSSWLCMTT